MVRISRQRFMGATAVALVAAESIALVARSSIGAEVQEEALDSFMLVLLCHFLIHQRPLLPQTAGASGQRFDQSDGQLTADACD
jgi:hypothetical protein